MPSYVKDWTSGDFVESNEKEEIGLKRFICKLRIFCHAKRNMFADILTEVAGLSMEFIDDEDCKTWLGSKSVVESRTDEQDRMMANARVAASSLAIMISDLEKAPHKLQWQHDDNV